MSTVDSIEKALAPVITEMGYELIDAEFKKEQSNWVLTLYIDSEHGVTIDDCEAVSKRVDPLLDELDPISQAYYLSVSSPGLDRPIKKNRDFERNIGKMILIKTYAPLMGKKEFKGKLLSFDENSFSFSEEKSGSTLAISRKDAAMIKPFIKF